MYFSIVIPTFRRPASLRRLLCELQKQAVDCPKDVEILVIDNCIMRSAEEVVREFLFHVSYIHEPNPGVSNARNRGIREASGKFVLFVDDDQLPDQFWLSAYQSVADGCHHVCFGPVLPVFDTNPPRDMIPLLESLFKRDINIGSGSDITRLRAYLGTGNSMFDREVCFDVAEPFDPRCEVGEDVRFLRNLAQGRRVKFTWCAEAVAHEYVPANRMSLSYARQRKFRNGQLRCLVEVEGGNWGAVLFYMMVGMAQLGKCAVLMLALLPIDRRRARVLSANFAGGLGKVLWWRP